jgi:chemotaxis response regulator CheB
VCRSLRVLCAADGPEALARLKRATVSASWELVGGAAAVDQLAEQAADVQPDVMVIAGLPAEAILAARSAAPRARLLAVADEPADGADQTVGSLEEVKAAVLGLPRPGGPVRA